jgi:hypothetical protein
MGGPQRLKGPGVHTFGSLDLNCDRLGEGSLEAPAVTIAERVVLVVEVFDLAVDHVGGVVGAHPAEPCVVTDGGEWESKARVTGELPAFVAVNVAFADLAGTIKRKVRVDEQQGMPGG